MITSVQTRYFLDKKGFIWIIFTTFVVGNTSSSRRLTEQCSMALLKIHKLCNALHNAREWYKNLRQREKKTVSGSRENVYI